ncbi:uncharacterized protein LOC129575609 isoform X1 [Sitodiplosis mosellana]|uniref:uncharacterized protein LOC129575609 isoform X1 n=1 Tax=Sitodiplosis mosellana TaxID=263140 RepID=UPI002444A46D|nr:uncharacterized protein LOC129575609 isoform X1 [Sitodiplosis mosellana]XP_055315446.1 uncharacterized protein LOC129575609 isoform X1 [Sitodiplosis mosellana]
MQVMRHILFGMLICTCLIGYSLAASLSLLMPASSRLPNNGHHSLSSISHSNALRNNYIKRSDELQTEVDQDVLDLESLKRVTNDAPTEKQGDKLATLEMQLAAASAVAATAAVNAGHHEQYDTSTYGNNEKQPAETDATIKVPSTDDVHSEIVTPNVNGAQGAQPKQYHGAARLAFGQNPEIVSSTSTSTTTTTTQIPVSTAITKSSSQISIDNSSSGVEHESTPPIEITNNGGRRSGNMNGAKNAEYLFKHSGGQYSALDMAQYVFWTGDEEGVAKAVEEFIRKGLMSRENAIKFLRDISMGIDYLENAYATNRQVDPIDDNSLRDYPPTVATTTTTTTTTTTQKPIILVEKSVIAPFGEIPSPLMQLNKIPNEKTKEHSVNFDEASGRLRLADFLYAEYSLEEVIYQLAKVMFSQSLSKGSEEAQIALQRLTTFLEGEGTSGRISPALQKKVLDVLLVALSDCLAENPQLFAAAKLSLGDTGGQLSKQPDKHFAMQINE